MELKFAEIFHKIGMLSNPGENQFLQVIRESQIVNALQHVINVNVLRGALNLAENDKKNQYMTTLYSPYFSVRLDIAQHYFCINSGGRIMVRENLVENGEWVDYNFKTHGYLPFGNLCDLKPRGNLNVLFHEATIAPEGSSLSDCSKSVTTASVVRFVDSNACFGRRWNN